MAEDLYASIVKPLMHRCERCTKMNQSGKSCHNCTHGRNQLFREIYGLGCAGPYPEIYTTPRSQMKERNY